MKPEDGKQYSGAGMARDGKNEELSADINAELNKDRKLLLNFRGSQDDYEKIYAEFSPWVYKYLVRRTGDADEAEDLTMETFASAFSGYGTFEWRGISFRAYVFKIARNSFISWQRKNKAHGKFKETLKDGHLEGSETSDAAILQEEDNANLAICLAKLTPIQRDAIELFYWNKLRTREIAVVLKIREGTLKSHLQRGREALKIHLQELGLDYASFGFLEETEEMPTVKNSFWSFIKKTRGEFSQ